jgi:Uma2 family endonuclease
MDALIQPLIQSPRLPRLVDELRSYVEDEAARRRRFYDEMREERKMEFINGEVVVQSPAKARHIDVTHRLLQLVRAYSTVHREGRVFAEKALVCLTRNDYEPDLAFFGPEKAAAITPEQMKFPAPDFVAEVLSPTTEKVDRGVKFEDYAAHGVAEYWIIDADAEIIEQYMLEESGSYRLAARQSDGELRSVVISGFAIPVRSLFDDDESVRTLRIILA